MKIIARTRMAGKTTELIRIAHKRRYSLLVVSSTREAHRVFQMAKSLDMPIPMPITYAEFLDKSMYGRNIDSFLIDNVEMFLQEMTHVPVEAFTVTYTENTTISPLLDDEKFRSLGIDPTKKFDKFSTGKWEDEE